MLAHLSQLLLHQDLTLKQQNSLLLQLKTETKIFFYGRNKNIFREPLKTFLLTHFSSMAHFYTPWKRFNTARFSWKIKMKHWLKLRLILLLNFILKNMEITTGRSDFLSLPQTLTCLHLVEMVLFIRCFLVFCINFLSTAWLPHRKLWHTVKGNLPLPI